MKRRLIALLLPLAMLLLPTPAAAVTMTTFEVQAWWRKAGISVPSAVGAHIHQRITAPKPGQIVNGVVPITVDVTLHDIVGKTDWIRWSDGSTVKGSQPLVMGPCADCVQTVTLPVDFSKFGSGLRELRISANIPDEDPGLSGSQRMFPSTGWPVCVRSCSPVAVSGRSLNFIEARGWYTGANYANARITTGIDSVREGGTVGVKLAPGSDGRTTRLAWAAIDPRYHDGDGGQELLRRTSAFTGNVTIPDLPPGPHRLVLGSSDGQNVGILSVPFEAS